MAKGKPRSQASKQQASRTLIRTTAERSRKARGYDVLLQLVCDGIACGGSTREFLRWVERAKFIIANEHESTPETSPAPEPPEKTWDCICGRSNYVTYTRCEHCGFQRATANREVTR